MMADRKGGCPHGLKAIAAAGDVRKSLKTTTKGEKSFSTIIPFSFGASVNPINAMKFSVAVKALQWQ